MSLASLVARPLLAGMFVYGGQSVNSGKLMTKATSISNDVLEQFRQLTFKQAYQLIETAYPHLSKLELFARGQPRAGWQTWGNQADPPAEADKPD